MKLPEYIKTLPRRDAANFRKWLVVKLNISASYARHLCNGRKSVPSKFAITIEQLTECAVSRVDTAPEHYPKSEYEDLYARVCKSFSTNMDQ